MRGCYCQKETQEDRKEPLMFVIISLKIELDANATLSHMESQIEEAGRAAMKEALKQTIRGAEGQQNRCPRCGSEQCQRQGTKRRILLSRFGRVEVPLKRLRCQRCQQLFRPAERCLAEMKGHNVTPELHCSRVFTRPAHQC